MKHVKNFVLQYHREA